MMEKIKNLEIFQGKNKILSFAILGMLLTTIVFVIVYSAINMVDDNGDVPVSAVEDRATEILRSNYNEDGYAEALEFFEEQIEKATTEEDYYSLQFDLANFYGDNGDPNAGIAILDTIDATSLPDDARYYLYASYIYLYELLGDSDSVANYQGKIESEKLLEYFEQLDDDGTEEEKDEEGSENEEND